MKRVLWALLGVLGGGVLLMVASLLFVRFAPQAVGLMVTPEGMRAYFDEASAPMPALNRLELDGKPMAWAATGPADGPIVLFIHGSPGDWMAWKGFFVDPALRHLRLLAVDRPGYGGSGRGQPMPSLEAQARMVAAVLREEGAEQAPALLVGHSLGGPVAGQVAVDHPNLVGGLVLAAASVDPELEETKWIQIPASWRGLRWLLPPELDVCNQEILPLRGELELLAKRWAGIDVPVHVIQGGADELVPPGNADFLESRLPEAEFVRVPAMSHFVPWRRPDLIRAAILHLKEKTKT
ncbi:MAG: alpha/beta fold hydrolase [Myxococcota bacterium]